MATWIRDPTRKLTLTESLGSNIRVKDRTYNLLISFVPITTRIDDNKTLCNIEQDNKIPCNSIIQMKWIKDPSRREENQQVAHVLMSLNSPKVANRLISEGIYYDLGKLRTLKDKKDPLHCLKCQHWGHMARNCTETKDTCGTCGGGHCHTKCNSHRTYYCANCKTNAHSSADKGCPEYQIQLAILNACTPENQMPYFPTEEPWTQVLLPPKPTGPIVHPHPPSTEAPQSNAAVLCQQTINWTAKHQEGKARQLLSGPVINSRTLVPLGQSKPRCMPPPPRSVDANGANIPNPSASSDLTQEPTTIPHTALHMVPMPFPLPSPLHLPGGLPITPQAIHDHPTQEETSPPPIPSLMNAHLEQPTLSRLHIWQQNLNTSHTAQLTLLNGPILDEWNILAIQEPALNMLGNTRANTHWRVAYPDRKYSHGEKPRAVMLVSSKLSTNAWRQVPFLSKDIVIIQLDTSGGKCTIVNVYNDNNHDNMVEELKRFLNDNIQELHPSNEDHMMWLGNFNRHHPLWDEDHNNHLFTPVALEVSNKLLKLVADHGMTQILPKDIPTLQSSSTQNWTCLDNMFCTEHTSELLLTCNTVPEKQGPKTDHLPILTVFNMSMPASAELPTWNYRSVNWDKFNSSLKD